MSDQTIIFSMAGVSKIYPPQKQVLKNIYLSFFYGAKIGVLGLNGSGKSSLLKIIAGVDKQFQGEVVFSPGYSVGYLEQEPQLDPTKTVREVVEEGAAETVALLKEYDEINEAFAVVAEKFIRDLKLDRDKVNVNGGACALGHPIGATGSILIGTVLDELERRDLKRGLVTMCAAGGMAPAVIIERI